MARRRRGQQWNAGREVGRMPDIEEVGEGFREPAVVRRLMDLDDGPAGNAGAS